MIQDAITWVSEAVLGLRIGQLGVAIALIGTAFYWRKAKTVAGLAGSVVGKVVVAAVAIGALRLLGVIPRLDVERGVELAEQGVSVGLQLVKGVA